VARCDGEYVEVLAAPTNFAPLPLELRHKHKLYKKSPGTRIRSELFSERVITVWNELSVSADFSTITRLKGSILNADSSDYLVCFNHMFCSVVHFFVFYVCVVTVHH